jgi:hypothetical protein
MEQQKTNDELKNLTPDELIKAKTGYGSVDEVRKQILQEAEA